MPGFTHLKNAQPISFAHYILAYVEMFNRDKKRLENNFKILRKIHSDQVQYLVHHLILIEISQRKKLGFEFANR